MSYKVTFKSDRTFSDQEYVRRIDAVKEGMAQRNIDVLMVTDPSNLLYLTGHQTSGYGHYQALFLPLEGEAFSVTRLLEESNMTSRTWLNQTFAFGDTQNPLAVAKDAYDSQGWSSRSLAYEKNNRYLTKAIEDTFLAEFSDCSLTNGSGIIEECRLIKSAEEIDVMKKVAKITEHGMRAGLDIIADGISENDIAATVHHAMFKNGGEYPAVPPYITSGPRTIIGHATWEGRKISKGEPVFLEIAGAYRRYHTAMMRTAFVGEPPHEMRVCESLVSRAIDESMKVMRPGQKASQVAKVCHEICMANTVGATQITRCGYSMGIAFAPSWDEGHLLSFTPNEERLFEENMTFHLIPWMQLPQQEMVMGISETVYVTQDGAKSLFDLTRQMTIA